MTDGHRQFHATQSLFSVNLAQSHFNGALSHIYTATYRLLMQHSCVSMQHSRSSMQHSRICMQHSRISMQHSRISMQHSRISVQHSRISVQHRPFLCSTVAFPCRRGGPYRPPYVQLNFFENRSPLRLTKLLIAENFKEWTFGQFAWIIGLVTLRITTDRTYLRKDVYY